MSSSPDQSPPSPGSAADRAPVPGFGVFGLYVFLASLAMLFGASIVGFLVIRAAHQPWPPPGYPELPWTLWISTAVILASSWTIQWALRAVRANQAGALQYGLFTTLALGVLFLALQALAWWQIFRQITTPATTFGPYVSLFCVLTGLHAAHVVGGLIPMGVTARRAYAGAYSEDRYGGVRHTAIYWHFLTVVWCVLFAVVYLC